MGRALRTALICGLSVGALGSPHALATPFVTPPPGSVDSALDVDGVGTRVMQAGDPSAREAMVFVHGNPDGGRAPPGRRPRAAPPPSLRRVGPA